MAKVTVYKVRAYNIVTDEFVVSRRMATAKGAEIMDAKIIDGSAIEIDESKLEPGQQWMERDFKPNGNGGFQRQV